MPNINNTFHNNQLSSKKRRSSASNKSSRSSNSALKANNDALRSGSKSNRSGRKPSAGKAAGAVVGTLATAGLTSYGATKAVSKVRENRQEAIDAAVGAAQERQFSKMDTNYQEMKAIVDQNQAAMTEIVQKNKEQMTKKVDDNQEAITKTVNDNQLAMAKEVDKAKNEMKTNLNKHKGEVTGLFAKSDDRIAIVDQGMKYNAGEIEAIKRKNNNFSEQLSSLQESFNEIQSNYH